MATILINLFCWGITLFWVVFLIKSAGGGATRYSGDDRQGAGSGN